MKRKTLAILSGLLMILLVTIACNLRIPGSVGIDNAATSVAATVNALAGTAEEMLTAIPHDAATEAAGEALPTMPPPAEEYPIKVSFVTPDGSLYLWADGTGTPLLLVPTDNICCSYISDDGELVAFSRYIDNTFASLEVINSDGTNRRMLLDAAAAAALPRPDDAIGTEPDQVAWIPGTHTLSFNTRHYFEGPGLFMNENFYLLDGESGVMETLLSTGNTTWQFRWSPDGSKVAISNPNGIAVYDSGGATIAGNILTYPFINTASEYAWTAYPIWSEDNTTLIARVPPQDPFFASGTDLNSSMWRVSADGLSGEQLFTGLMEYRGGGETGVSPDLSKMLYYVQTGVPADNTYNLIVSNVDGSGSSVYATGQFQSDPVWSPDNSHFFYSVGWLPDSVPYIGQVGAAPTPVIDFTNSVGGKWIDDNRYLTVTNDDGRWRLLLGTVGSATGVIYDSVGTSSNQITLSVNR